MIKQLKEQKVILLFVLSLFAFHWFSKDITDSYQRPIVGDAQAYYSYLPAIFIYQDLEYTFFKPAAEPYYPEGQLKDFVKEVDGRKVNKTFPGVAVLYLPFFLLGHLSAFIFGFPTDGFSTIYQFWFDIGHWFYFLFGLVFLRKTLEKLRFSSKIALFSTILIAIGTNIFFYTVYDQSVTHIHNFFMINGLLLCLLHWRDSKQSKWLISALVLLVLIGITRPTNILVFGLIFIFFGQKMFYFDAFRSILSKKWWKYAVFTIPIVFLPFLLWKLQTGKWIVYSYGEEGFDFTDPYFFSFLFSYMKGWLLYTPIVIPIALLGLPHLFIKSKRQFILTIVFYLIAIYIFSSWWCWYYGAGMSQRVMIDHYVLLAYLLALGLKYLWEKPLLRNAFLGLLFVISALNVVQAYQVFSGIIRYGSADKVAYWDNFLVLEKRTRVYPKENWILQEEVQLTPKEEARKIGAWAPFSPVHTAVLEEVDEESKLVLSMEVLAHQDVKESRAVFSLKDARDQKEVPHVFYLNEYARKGEWVKMEFLLQSQMQYQDTMGVYFWIGDSQEQLEYKNLKVQHFKGSDEY